jgi:hypothetical protein
LQSLSRQSEKTTSTPILLAPHLLSVSTRKGSVLVDPRHDASLLTVPDALAQAVDFADGLSNLAFSEIVLLGQPSGAVLSRLLALRPDVKTVSVIDPDNAAEDYLSALLDTYRPAKLQKWSDLASWRAALDERLLEGALELDRVLILAGVLSGADLLARSQELNRASSFMVSVAYVPDPRLWTLGGRGETVDLADWKFRSLRPAIMRKNGAWHVPDDSFGFEQWPFALVETPLDRPQSAGLKLIA